MNACNYLHGDDRSGDPVDDKAERGPPPGVGNKPTAMLPKIFQPVTRQANDQQPWRSRHGSRGDDDEDRGDTALNSDYAPASIGYREADVHRRDRYAKTRWKQRVLC
jgi:hypothetical protein